MHNSLTPFAYCRTCHLPASQCTYPLRCAVRPASCFLLSAAMCDMPVLRQTTRIPRVPRGCRNPTKTPRYHEYPANGLTTHATSQEQATSLRLTYPGPTARAMPGSGPAWPSRGSPACGHAGPWPRDPDGPPPGAVPTVAAWLGRPGHPPNGPGNPWTRAVRPRTWLPWAVPLEPAARGLQTWYPHAEAGGPTTWPT